MKRFFLWLLMVALFTGAIVGGSLAFLYYHITEEDLPEKAITLAGQTLDEPVGYQWTVPILGGMVWRELDLSPGSAIQTLEAPITTASAELVLAEGMTESATTLLLQTKEGETLFEGGAAQWKDYTFPEDGVYLLTIRAGCEDTGQRPGKAYGWYQYQCRFTVSAAASITLSSESVRQGDTAAIYVSGLLGQQSDPPVADTDLGQVWFAPVSGGWIGYLGIPYNAPGGDHTITAEVGSETLTATLTVGASQYTTTPLSGGDATAEANAQFRDKIYSFYTQGTNEKLWTGRFSPPVQGNIFQPYGAYLIADDGSRAGQAANLTYVTTPGSEVIAPAPGKVLLAENLLLTGNTLVIDHGCGVKSYLYHLQDLNVSVGSVLTRDQVLGHAQNTLIWEVRVGNKSVDPAKLTQTTGGLFFQP